MKLTTFLIFVGLLSVSASSYSQMKRLNLNMKDAHIVDVLNAIEQQSDFYFFFKNDEINRTEKVDAQFQDTTIDNILSKVLKNTGLGYKIVDHYIVISPETDTGIMKQTGIEKIRGKVEDKNGLPVPGASVVVKGTTIGTITDGEGNFSLSNIPANAVLVFSFVGMKTQEVSAMGKTELNIVLQEETIGMEEVVVIGYGTQKKANLTGAVSAVKIDEKIASRSLVNVSSGLQGLLPGLAINQNSGMAGKNDVTMLIRGLGTVNNANPLIVVDGMPDVDINRLNMNDIESVSVLKDATSSAVYGSRAANGVILITTKSGNGMDKTKINITSSYSLGVPTGSLNFVNNYAKALTIHQYAAASNTRRSDFTYKDGTIDQWLALGMIDPLRYPSTDWWDVIMRTSKIQNHSISASGGNDKSTFFISIGVMDEKGLQLNNNYSLYNARINYDYKIRKNINVGVKFNGNWSKVAAPNGEGFSDDGYGLRFGADASAGLTPYDPETGYFGGAMAYNDIFSASFYNPYLSYTNALVHQNRQEANASMFMDWSPFKGLTTRISYALNYYNQFSYLATIPTKAYNFQTNSFTYDYISDNAGIKNDTYTGYKTLLNGQIDYHINIAQDHDLSALFVYSEEYWYDRYQGAFRQDRIHPSLHEIDAALPNTQYAYGNSSAEGLQSYIGRINYSAFNKYLFEANFRYDGSSKFLAGSQFGFFPSASVGWRLTEEKFIKPLTENWLSNGKLRISYGGLGNNSGVGKYEQQETLVQSNYVINGETVKGFTYQKMTNPNLSWESTYVFNVGFDLGFVNNHLTAELDYYDRLTTGMLRPSDLSIHLTGAYVAPRKNIGNLRNKGVEGNLIWKDSKGDFAYSINLNASYNATRLEKWNEFLGKGNIFIDMPYLFTYAYEAIGIAQSWEDIYKATPQGASPGDILLKDLNGDGIISGEDKKAYSHIQRDKPTTNYALILNASWKGFDFSALLQGTAGRKDFWLTNANSTSMSPQSNPSTWDLWNNAWTWNNRDGIWPRFNGNSLNEYESTFWLDDMSYLRFKNLQIGYTLPQRYTDRIKFQNIRIYLSGENIVTFTKYRGIDPEKSTKVDDAYPLVKSFALGINITI